LTFDDRVADSGKRETYEGGMVRDTEEGKTDFMYVYPGPMLERWAIHLMKGAVKYEKNNWLKAKSQAALDRYERSALRHIRQWITGENTWEYDEELDEWVEIIEDHAAAVLFNINGAEYVRAILERAAKAEDKGPGAVLVEKDSSPLETEGLLAATIDAYFDAEPTFFSGTHVAKSERQIAWDALFAKPLGDYFGLGGDIEQARVQRTMHEKLAADFSAYVDAYWNTEETVATTSTEITEAKLKEAYDDLVKGSEAYNARVIEGTMPTPKYRAPLDATDAPPVVPGFAETDNDCGDDECGCGPR